jgi:hypothetical protein
MSGNSFSSSKKARQLGGPLISADGLEGSMPVAQLALSFFFGDAIALLDFAGEHFLIALDLLKVVIREFTPLLLDLALKLFPIP